MKNKLWTTYLEEFKNQMGEKIGANMQEKGFSWREPSERMGIFLAKKLSEYYEAGRWLDVANIAFMLWDRKQRGIDISIQSK